MKSTDAQRTNIELVRSTLDNAMAGRLELTEPVFPDDFVLYEAEGLPFGGVYRGWQGYREICMKLKKFFSDRKLDSREFIPYGDDRVMVHFTLDGHIATNGQHVRMPVIALWEIRDGKFSSIRPFFFDTKSIADLVS